MFDLLLIGGEVIEGPGGTGFEADAGLAGNRIIAVSRLTGRRARRTGETMKRKIAVAYALLAGLTACGFEPTTESLTSTTATATSVPAVRCQGINYQEAGEQTVKAAQAKLDIPATGVWNSELQTALDQYCYGYLSTTILSQSNPSTTTVLTTVAAWQSPLDRCQDAIFEDIDNSDNAFKGAYKQCSESNFKAVMTALVLYIYQNNPDVPDECTLLRESSWDADRAGAAIVSDWLLDAFIECSDQ